MFRRVSGNEKCWLGRRSRPGRKAGRESGRGGGSGDPAEPVQGQKVSVGGTGRDYRTEE